MIASAEQRRSAMLREVNRHRASLASRLRLASDEVCRPSSRTLRRATLNRSKRAPMDDGKRQPGGSASGRPKQRRLRAGFVDRSARRGPLTASGKARASKNARRHGPSLSLLRDPAASVEIEDSAAAKYRIVANAANPSFCRRPASFWQNEIPPKISVESIDCAHPQNSPLTPPRSAPHHSRRRSGRARRGRLRCQ
jgi:hypothetical protein